MLRKMLMARTSTNENSMPRVVPRYHWRLKKLISSLSLMTAHATIAKKPISRSRSERESATVPPIKASGIRIRPTRSLVSIRGFHCRMFAGLVEENISAGHPRATGTYTFKNLVTQGIVLAANGRVPPGIIHDDASAGPDELLRVPEADRTHLIPLFTAIDDDDIKFPPGQRQQILGLLETDGIFKIKRTKPELHVLEAQLPHPVSQIGRASCRE